MEKWKNIPGQPNYEASDLGRVRRIGKVAALKPDILKGGYAVYALSHDGIVKKHLGHKLILLTFVGEVPDGMESDHVDFDRANNELINLQYLTHEENAAKSAMAGRYKTGEAHWTKVSPEKVSRGENHGSNLHPETVRRGILNGRAKIDNNDVFRIREMREAGLKLKEIGDAFGMSISQIHNICKNLQWRHVK